MVDSDGKLRQVVTEYFECNTVGTPLVKLYIRCSVDVDGTGDKVGVLLHSSPGKRRLICVSR